MQGRKDSSDVLAYASLSDVQNYERHFSKLEGAGRGEVSLLAAEQYFTSSLIKVRPTRPASKRKPLERSRSK